MCTSLAVLGLFLCLTSGASTLLPTWHMHRVCGQTISQRDKGGFLVLDSGTFPADGNIDCRVVIQPSVIRSSSFAENHVAFHLSDFEVGASCKDTNFTVHDGHGKQTKAIAGLKTPLCGANSSLSKEITFFTTEEDFLTVVYQRDKTASALTSKFNMTFWSLSEGECWAGEFDAFSCNGTKDWCIDKDLVCKNLNPCTDNSDCPKVVPEDIEFNLLAVILPIALFLLFVSCCCCIIQSATDSNFRDRCGNKTRQLVQIARDIGYGIGGCICTEGEDKREDESAVQFHSDVISVHSDRYEPGPSEAAANDMESTLTSSTQHKNDYSTLTKEREAAASNYHHELSPSAPPLKPEAAAPPSHNYVMKSDFSYFP